MQAYERLARVLRSHRGLVLALAAPFALVLYFSYRSLAFNSRGSSDSMPLAVVKLSGRPHAKLGGIRNLRVLRAEDAVRRIRLLRNHAVVQTKRRLEISQHRRRPVLLFRVDRTL